jgi:hypothetical protein
MTVLDRLAERLAEMKTGDISKSTVHRLMVLLRELLGADECDVFDSHESE